MMYVVRMKRGEFEVPDEVIEQIGREQYASLSDYDLRTNEHLIKWIKEHKRKRSLALVDIPDEATAWEKYDYDGLECVLAIVDGELVRLNWE